MSQQPPQQPQRRPGLMNNPNGVSIKEFIAGPILIGSYVVIAQGIWAIAIKDQERLDMVVRLLGVLWVPIGTILLGYFAHEIGQNYYAARYSPAYSNYGGVGYLGMPNAYMPQAPIPSYGTEYSVQGGQL